MFNIFLILCRMNPTGRSEEKLRSLHIARDEDSTERCIYGSAPCSKGSGRQHLEGRFVGYSEGSRRRLRDIGGNSRGHLAYDKISVGAMQLEYVAVNAWELMSSSVQLFKMQVSTLEDCMYLSLTALS